MGASGALLGGELVQAREAGQDGRHGRQGTARRGEYARLARALGGAVGKRAASERRPAVGSGRAALEFVRKRDREAADDGRGCVTCIHAVRVGDIGLAGLARPCWAASPFRYFFYFRKK
jgi:hypothetical protein